MSKARRQQRHADAAGGARAIETPAFAQDLALRLVREGGRPKGLR